MCLQGVSSPLSPIFVTLVPSLLKVFYSLEKKMTTKILKMTKQLRCTLVKNGEIELVKLADLEKRDKSRKRAKLARSSF